MREFAEPFGLANTAKLLPLSAQLKPRTAENSPGLHRRFALVSEKMARFKG